MRFHIGFSKRISIKKLIEIIGFLFIACLTFFGIYDTTHAWTDLDYTNFDREIIDNQLIKDDNFNPIDVNYNSDNYGYYSITSNKFFILGLTDFSSSYNYVTNDRTFKLNNNFDHSCAASDSSLKSIDFKFHIQNELYPTGSNYTSAIAKFNQTINSNLYDFYVYAHDSNNDVDYSTVCTDVESYSVDYYYQNINVTCERVFSGNSNYQIDYFKIGVLNAIPFNNFYLNNSVDYPYGSWYMTLDEYQYQCNDNEPNVEGGFPGDDDPAGLGYIYDVIRDDYSTDLPGIDISSTLLKLPTTFTDLLLLPFDVVRAVVNNSYQCTPYEIDFTSIMTKWGDSDSSYVLTLPCMRDVLSGKLKNWYTVADLLICFLIFYDITMHVINLVNAITSGEDLFSYFFKPTNNKTKYVDSSTGEVISRG